MKRRSATVGINCMGLWADESSSRQRMSEWDLNKALCNRRRTVYNWLPVHRLSEAAVFGRIRLAGQRPFWA